MSRSPADSMQLEGRFWLDRGGKPFLGPGRVALLERIDACRSIAEAARAMGMGYKTAWDLVDAMNQLAEQPLVVRVKGGRQGGGTELTD
ncbi:MAG TPA: LysR family transcriptional regulator, partial [Plasticicumulans sp.]|nr:LysR family transcriptional regulator [Plasticicumulans sp.]